MRDPGAEGDRSGAGGECRQERPKHHDHRTRAADGTATTVTVALSAGATRHVARAADSQCVVLQAKPRGMVGGSEGGNAHAIETGGIEPPTS